MSDETVGDECVRRVPLPATRFYDAMRAGHRARVGHELRAYLVCAGGGIHDIVRRCCGESDAGHDHTLCCGPGSPWAAWTEITQPESAQLLLVVADGSTPVALWGPVGSEPQIREAVAGQLYAACIAALTPVPADDPLVVELAELARG